MENMEACCEHGSGLPERVFFARKKLLLSAQINKLMYLFFF